MSQTIHSHLLSLDPDEVDATGEWLFRTEEPGEALLHSLERCGQIHPVLLVREGGCFFLCTGYKRWAGCRALGISLLARETRADDLQKGRLSLQAHLPAPIEDATLIKAARYFQHCRPKEGTSFIQRELASFLHPKRLRILLSWLSLPRDFDRHLKEGRIPFQAGAVLAHYQERELEAVEPLFAELRWSQSRAVQFLNWLLEASRREGTGVQELVAQRGLTALSRAEQSPKDRLERLSAQARALRYPELTAIEAEFSQFQQQVRRTGYWRLEAEPSFERDTVFLQAQIASARDLEKAEAELRSLREARLMDRLRCWQEQRLNARQGDVQERK